MDSAPVSSIVSLSIPIPMPPAGGIPCSRASRNSSSIFCLSSPACSTDFAVTAMKSTVAATTAAFDQFSKATKQVVSYADASVRAASANAANVAKATAKTTKGRKA